MPELPEIEVLKNKIRNSLINREIVEVKVSNERVINLPKNEFRKSILNTVLVATERKGKMLILRLSNTNYLLIHLMLFGKIRLVEEIENTQVAIGFDNNLWLTFNQLALGACVHLYQEDINKIERVVKLGIDALSITLDELKRIFSSQKGKVKTLLMNQRLIAGIGNIYADEILFRAKVHPEKNSKLLKEEEIISIYEHINGVLKEAISLGGALSYNFSHIDESEEGFVPQVHYREGQPCHICKTQIRKIKVGGRGTNYCPSCQKEFV